jgi:response regulator RpfG family c-di-GMP phosphodiesterase
VASPVRVATVAVAAVAILTGLIGQLAGALPSLERDAVKARFATGHREAPRDVVIVDIDTKTFTDLRRQWPFPRSVHARMVDVIAAAEPKEIVYDVQFTEATERAEDEALAAAIEQAGGAVLAVTESDDEGNTDVLGGRVLEDIGAEAGAANLDNDVDGVISRVPYADARVRSMSVVVAERVRGRRVDPGVYPEDGAWIDWRGGPGTFRTLSFSDVLEKRVDLGVLRDAIVIVGSSAPTLQDVHATPMTTGPLMSGPEIQANAIVTVLEDFPLRDAPAWLAGLLVLLLGLVAPLVRGRVRTPVLVVGAVALAALYALAAQAAFALGWMLPVTWPLLALAVGLVGSLAVTNVLESRGRLRVARDNELLEERVRERTAELQETQLEVVHRLALAAELRDDETGRHIERLGELCHRLALAIGMPAAEAEVLRHAAVLHDVGKIGIPDEVLHKPGGFDPDERALMRTHAQVGAELLSGGSSDLMRMAQEIALTHHEKWDGTGYPNGLAGEDIPLVGRICAICDVYDALLSERPYKRPWPLEDVLEELRGQAGRHFDPRLVASFLAIAPRLHAELHGGERASMSEPASAL